MTAHKKCLPGTTPAGKIMNHGHNTAPTKTAKETEMVDLSILRSLALEAMRRAEFSSIPGTIQAAASTPNVPHPEFSQVELATAFGLPVYPVATSPGTHYLLCPCCESTSLDSIAGDASMPSFTACWKDGTLKVVERPNVDSDETTLVVHHYVECLSCRRQFAVSVDDRRAGQVEMVMMELPKLMRLPVNNGSNWTIDDCDDG